MTRRQGRRHHRERLGDSGSRTSLALKDHAQVRQDREAGSIIPPLTLACLVRVPFLPLTLLSHIGQPPGRTIALIGLERFFVPQQNTDLCWAAALQTARAYLGLQNVSLDEIPAVMSKECPELSVGTGRAQAYQIIFTSGSLLYHRDRLFHEPIGFCSTEACIANAIMRGRPVIALKSSHAVLIQGLEIEPGTPDLIRNYHILDPNGNGTIDVLNPLEMCTTDAFIVL